MSPRFFAPLAACALLAACGGGAGGSTVPAPVQSIAPTSSPSPTPTPAPTPHASQSSVTFQSGGPQNVSVMEAGYTGAFTENDTCNPLTGAIAGVAARSNAAGSAVYAITPLSAGTCAVTISDSAGRGTTISVSVASAAIIIH